MSDLKDLVAELEANVRDPLIGLPDEVFYLVSRLTPYVNVDLLLNIPKRGVLLTWRDDPYTGAGWHIPGGIIRFRENAKTRVDLVAQEELGIKVDHAKGPIEVNELIADHRDRSHFISLLYLCSIDLENLEIINEKIEDDPTQINFFRTKPKDLISWHQIYADFFQ
ncbi:NUDIX hydrolase [Arenicellales bacterium nBUS_48]